MTTPVSVVSHIRSSIQSGYPEEHVDWEVDERNSLTDDMTESNFGGAAVDCDDVGGHCCQIGLHSVSIIAKEEMGRQR